ncbi:MAG TPA: hypothetical protein VGM64_07630 [Lacunisphaera sp.]|jgi:hypothetical protein
MKVPFQFSPMALMKPIAIATLLMALGAVIGRYGPAVASYAIIPAKYGYFRHYRDTEADGIRWEYWMIKSSNLVSGSFYRDRFFEEWEIVRGSAGEYFLYDDHAEFDRTLTFSRTEMVIRDQDGNEHHYPRVMDLWEVWLERINSESRSRWYDHIDARKARYAAMIAQRMKKYGLVKSPASEAQRRPPVIKPMVADNRSQMKPLLAVTEYDFFDHAETGTVFVLYADGTAICRSIPANPESPFHMIEPADTKDLFVDLIPTDFDSLATRYKLSSATDQVITRFWFSGKTVELYGPWREPKVFPNDTTDYTPETIRENNASMREEWLRQPASLRHALSKIDELRKAAGPAWLPKRIEVQFSGELNMVQGVVPWPKKWPGLYDTSSKKRGIAAYSVFIPSKDFAELNAFLASAQPHEVVLIDLNQMHPEIHFPLPNEDDWTRQETW